MVASSVDIQSPPSGIDLPDGTDGILRPRTDMEWAGGTGPFNVRYEWDTSSAFNTGNLITQTNNSVTSPDFEVPLSDLGGSTWYCRATVIDTGDSNAELASAIHTLDYTDPQDRTRFISLQTNAGVAFSPTDSPLETQLIYHDHTGGTFTLSFDGQGPTSSINWNDPASTIKTRLQSLSNITTVDVVEVDIGSGWTAWRVTFVDPGGESEPLITLSSSLTGGATAAVIEIIDGGDWDQTAATTGTEGEDGLTDLLTRFMTLQTNLGVGFDGDASYPQDDPREVQIIYHDATGGNFTLSFDGQGPTGNIAYNALPSAVETALELLSNIDSVLVEDVVMNGATAWRVTFLDPNRTNEAQITINDAGLTGDTFADVYTVQHGADWDGSTSEGTVGPDGQTAPRTLTEFVHLQTNLGVGFSPTDGVDLGADLLTPPGFDFWPADGFNNATPEGIGETDLLSHFLHLQTNVVTTQPCPFLFSVSPTVLRVGDTATLRGQGLVGASSPTSDPYDAEVRLYSTPDLGGSYQVMTITSYDSGNTEDTIGIEIPSGATSGWLAVVHTTTPSCTGSNFKYVTITAQQPDSDAGWWIEVWNIRGTQRLISQVKVRVAFFQPIMNEIGSGYIELPAFIKDPTDATKNLIDSISDPDGSPKVERLIKVFLDGVERYGFFSRTRSDPYGEKKQQLVRIAGPGRESVVDWGMIAPADFQSSDRIQNPDPVYGSTVNVISNSDMEEGGDPISNGDMEAAVEDPWEASGTATIELSSTVFRTGAFSMRVVPTATNDGVEQSLSVTEGSRLYVDAWFKDTVGSGDTAQLRLYYINDADAKVQLAAVTTTLSSIWTRIGTYAVIPDGVTTVFVEARNTTGTTIFYVDDVEGASEVTPWIARNASTDGAVVTVDDTHQVSGRYSMRVEVSDTNDGAEQIVSVQPSTKYTATAQVYAASGKLVDFRAFLGGLMKVDSITGNGDWQTVTFEGTTGAEQTAVNVDFLSKSSGAQTFWVEDVVMTPGEPAAPGGTILLDQIAAIQARGTLPFLQTDFTTLRDSAGELWDDNQLALALSHGRPLSTALDQLVGFGLDWQVTSGYVLQLFNEMGVDLTQLPDSVPVITEGIPIYDGNHSGENPRVTTFYGEGAGSIWTSKSEPSWETELERREGWVTNPNAADTATLGKLLTSALDNEDARGEAIKLQLASNSRVRPFLHFQMGDTIKVDLVSQKIQGNFRVVGIAVRLDQETATYTLDLNRLEYEREMKTAAVLARLLAKGTDSQNLGVGGGSVGSGSLPVTSSPTTGTTQVLPDHQHSIPGDIKNPQVGGDLGGLLPNPTVTRIRGRVVGTDVPDDGDAYLWDDTLKLWTPGAAGGGGGGGVPADSVIGRLYTRPTTVRGLTRTYKTESDEFDGVSISGWTQVDGDGGGSSQNWFQEADVLGLEPTGWDASGIQAQVKAIPSGDWTAETAIRRFTQESFPQIGLVVSTSATEGSGTQLTWMRIALGTDEHYRGIQTNWNGTTGSYVGADTEMEGDLEYMRMIYDSSGDTITFQVSPDGLSWITLDDAYSVSAYTLTHFGVAMWMYATVESGPETMVGMFEYFRVYTEA